MLSALTQGSVASIGYDAAGEFAAGYLYGATARVEDKRPYIMDCFTTDNDLNGILDQIMIDYANHDVKSGDDGWIEAQPMFQKAIKNCTEVTGEFKDLSNYAKNISKDTIKARSAKYTTEINQRGENMATSWKNGVYFDAGMYNGEITAYMGLVPNTYSDMLEVDSQRDPDAVPQFNAGWLYGISGQHDEMRNLIVECYKADAKLEDDYFQGMAAYEDGKGKKGDKLFKDAITHFDGAFAGCDPKIISTLKEWNSKISNLHDMKDW